MTDKQHDRISKMIKTVLSEYLDGYILFGFDAKGNAFMVPHIQNKRDEISTVALVQKFLMNYKLSDLDDVQEDGNLDD